MVVKHILSQMIDKQVSLTTLELAKEVNTFLDCRSKCPLQLFLETDSNQNVELKAKTENIPKNESSTNEVPEFGLKPSKQTSSTLSTEKREALPEDLISPENDKSLLVKTRASKDETSDTVITLDKKEDVQDKPLIEKDEKPSDIENSISDKFNEEDNQQIREDQYSESSYKSDEDNNEVSAERSDEEQMRVNQLDAKRKSLIDIRNRYLVPLLEFIDVNTADHNMETDKTITKEKRLTCSKPKYESFPS